MTENTGNETRFKLSAPENEHVIGEVHAAILNEIFTHPVMAFAQVTNTPAANNDFFARLGYNFEVSENLKNFAPYLFPEPADMMDICLHLGVHPADLVPTDTLNPAPRSIVKLCKDIASGNDFPKADQDAANDFLEQELELIYAFQESHPEIWNYIRQRDADIEEIPRQTIELSWRPPHDPFLPRPPAIPDFPKRRRSLAPLFDGAIKYTASELSPFPIALNPLTYHTAINKDLREIDRLKSTSKRLDTRLKNSERNLIKLGDAIWGPGMAMVIYDEVKAIGETHDKDNPFSRKIVSGILSGTDHIKVDPTALGYTNKNSLNASWLNICRDFTEDYKRYQQSAQNLETCIEAFQEEHAPFMQAKRYLLEYALAFNENLAIIEADHPVTPHLRTALDI